MSDGFQYGDIIFLGLVAGFVALRLRSMLGKNGGSIEPRDVWKQAGRDVIPDKSPAAVDRVVKKAIQEEETMATQQAANPVIADGLKAIKAADASFSTTEFVSGARLAFEWLVEAFSKGDKDKLRVLLSDERYQHFVADIDARGKDGLKQETTLVSVISTDLTEAQLQGTRAQITVQFTSEQVSVTRDKGGSVVSGDPSALERVIDVWTFERNIASRDPNWKIVAT